MRVLRALFNFAAGQYEDAKGHSLIAENPVKRLSQTRAWYRVKRRQTYIKPHELAAWGKGIAKNYQRNTSRLLTRRFIYWSAKKRSCSAQME